MQAAQPNSFTASLDTTNGRAVIAVSGEMDLTTEPVLHRLFVSALDLAPNSIAIDLGGVTFLDAAGVGALLAAASLAGERGCEVTIEGARPAVAKVLRMLDVHDRLPIQRSRA